MPLPPTHSVQSLKDQRRRRAPPTDSDILSRILEAHGAVVGAGLDRDAVVAAILDRAQTLTHSSGAVIELIEGDHLVYGAVSGTLSGLSGLRVRTDSSLSGLSVTTGSVLRCDDSEDDPRVDRDTCRRAGLRSMLVAPLPFAGRPIGVLKVVSPFVRTYSDADVRTLQHLNALMGNALGNAERYTEAASRRRDAGGMYVAERAQLIDDIAEARFSLVFQPVVNLLTRRVMGFETLLRPTTAESTDDWFERVRNAELEQMMDTAIIRRALQALPDLPDDTYLAVNVCPDSLVSEEIGDLCMAAPDRIVLELTEHRAVADYSAVVARSRALRRRGVRLAIDDMGAGFSSLRHVLRLEPDYIKLDRSIVVDVDLHARHEMLISSMVTFAKGTRSVLIAEGIETEAQLRALIRAGIDLGQGYYLRAPASTLVEAAQVKHTVG